MIKFLTYLDRSFNKGTQNKTSSIPHDSNVINVINFIL